jgi:poly(ADP-ribose) glycohydrolase
VSRLFTAELESNECLVIIGAERYCNYSGYRASFTFAGDHLDKTPRDKLGRIQTVIIGIDAVHLRSPASQYRPELVLRELNKAYSGFFVSFAANSNDAYLAKWPIATGNWGCGAFGGHKEAKSLIQLMAAAPLRKKILYFTFGEVDFEVRFRQMYNILSSKKVTVAGVLSLFEQYQTAISGFHFSGDLFSFILKKLAPQLIAQVPEREESSPIQLTP